MLNFTPQSFASAVVTAATILAFATSAAGPVQASDARTKAFKACAAKTSETFGRGKMIDAKSKRRKNGYAISMTKLNTNGDIVAEVSCRVSKGVVIEFETKTS